jgi:hypothetical protein
MALTPEQTMALTPEQIAEMMTDDVSVNNGLKSSHKPQSPPVWRTTRHKSEALNNRYLAEQVRAMRAELELARYGAGIPTRVPIIPKQVYRPRAKKPIIAEHKESKITSNLGKRKIKL